VIAMADAKESPQTSVDRDQELTTPAAVKLALDYITTLTGKQVVSATSAEPTDDGWLVGVEVVEESRIPSTSDMLALYEVELDLRGELLAYRRTRRYLRGRSNGGSEGR
jgi:hypothetical protein